MSDKQDDYSENISDSLQEGNLESKDQLVPFSVREDNTKAEALRRKLQEWIYLGAGILSCLLFCATIYFLNTLLGKAELPDWHIFLIILSACAIPATTIILVLIKSLKRQPDAVQATDLSLVSAVKEIVTAIKSLLK